ncbi:hypothetical protein Q7P37_009032 [Cladosporium fusiforme]
MNWKIDEVLQRWTKGKRIIRADHFFWILGAAMQKSREGLLRSLLYSALRSASRNTDGDFDSGFIKHACGPRWLSDNSRRPWDCDELFQILARLTSVSEAKFFFLVDALDECDPQDRPGDIAAEILRVSQLPNVKLCISCRPWAAFTSRFSHAQVLWLDQLTYHDMELYVENRLASAESDHDLCTEFRGKTAEAVLFVNEVVRAAEGVFLWIELVLKDLCSGLKKGHDFEKLREALQEFPVGLDGYFKQLIFERVTKTRQNNYDTAAVLKLAIAIASAQDPTYHQNNFPDGNSFLNFWLLKSGHLVPGFSWKDHANRWYTPDDVQLMVAQTKSFLEESCKDLLVMVEERERSESNPLYHHFHSDMRWDVQFLHRTVIDFLRDDGINTLIEEKSPDHFACMDFLTELHKLRAMCLCCEEQKGCKLAEQSFQEIICACQAQRSTSCIMEFASACEALVIQRFNSACKCLDRGHLWYLGDSSIIDSCVEMGLTGYLSTVVHARPHLAVRGGTYPRRGGPAIPLEDALSGCLEFARFALDQRSEFGILDESSHWMHTAPSSWHRIHSQQDRFIYQDVLLSLPPAHTLGGPCIGLIDTILQYGGDPNRKHSLHGEIHPGTPSECEPTVWEKYLIGAFRKLRRIDQRAGTSTLSADFSRRKRYYQGIISDVIALLLQHGAAPDCAPCISDHIEEPCLRVSLADMLATLVPMDQLNRMSRLRFARSKIFHPHIMQRNFIFRAVKSLILSERSRVAHAKQLRDLGMSDEVANSIWLEDHIDTVQTVATMRMRVPQPCNKCDEEKICRAQAWCVDCSKKYVACYDCYGANNAGYLEDSVLMENIVHESLPSVEQHTAIVFRGVYWQDGDEIHAKSFTALKEWYAKNTTGEDAGVD